MAAHKKPTPKKAKAPVKAAAATKTKASAKRTVRTQAATGAYLGEQEATMTLALVSLFALLSVLFATMAYWRYHL